ncbi:protein kinase-like domain, concanavalin A-like lectin/glucanase domain protein [Tanacetum coccineum]
MGDENPIRTLGDYSKPSHESYRNTIELPVGNNVVPLLFDTIRLVQNGCSFHELWSEDPNQHLKDFLKLVDALDLDGENRERTRLHLFQISLRDQASNWLERLPAGSISTWEDLTTRFLAQFFLPGRTAKLCNDILMFQQHHEESLSEAWTRNYMAPKSIAAISHDEREELRRKGIKSPSKLLSPKYLSPASIKELNKNLTAPKRVHFINPIVILSTDSDTEEEDVSSTNACDLNLGSMVKGKEEVKEQGMDKSEMENVVEVEEVIEEEESEFETDEEVEEILEEEKDDEDDENFNSFPTMEELTHHEWLMKNPRPPCVKAKIRARSPNNIKISCIVGHFFKRHAYIHFESPINIMSRQQYNKIRTYGLTSRQKPSNPNKTSNFVGRIRGLNIFIGSFAYECVFMILEYTTSIIDHHLGEMVLGRPFIEETGLVYNKEEGSVMFKQDDEKITFKMPHTMKVFEQTRLMGLSTDSIPPSAYEENFRHERTHYYQSLLIEDEYKQDGGDRRGIGHLMRLYLMRRSLEVLKKFHWMILGGRFNQLSHISSPLLSKPGEY